jgi:Bacterial pre-peptidase C-terminal domain
VDTKKAGMALWTAFILFLAPMAIYAGNGEMQNTLGQNERLRVSEELKSTNGKYTLRMQDDGNLVAYDSQGKGLWSSDTVGSGAIECIMQDDGNLFLKDRNGRTVWTSHTDGYNNAKLVIQDDGNLVIYNQRGLAVWAKGKIKDSLSRGENLLVNEFIRSQNRKYTLRMQDDGNLVAYDTQRKALWNSDTVGSGAIECVLQGDGNLLLKDRNGKNVWATNTNGYSDATLLIQDDGHVVLYKEGGIPFWSNGNINTNIRRDTTPAEVPAEVSHQNDAGSGRDAGNVLDEAVPIYPVNKPADGELSSTDNIDFYSIPLGKGWRLSLTLTFQSGQDYNVALLDSNGDVQASSARKTGQVEYLEFTPPSSLTYYIRVSRKAGQGHYKIELSFHNPESIKDNLPTRYDPDTGDNDYDNALNHLNNVALADLDNFINKLSSAFGISQSWIENLIRRENIPPADVYMMARTASVTKHPIDTVQKNYMANRGQGWGVMAKQLGIKPGSNEFHALKKDNMGWLSKGKSQGQKKEDKDNS